MLCRPTAWLCSAFGQVQCTQHGRASKGNFCCLSTAVIIYVSSHTKNGVHDWHMEIFHSSLKKYLKLCVFVQFTAILQSLSQFELLCQSDYRQLIYQPLWLVESAPRITLQLKVIRIAWQHWWNCTLNIQTICKTNHHKNC